MGSHFLYAITAKLCSNNMSIKSIIRFFAGVMLPVLLLSSCGSDYVLDIYGSISGKVTDSLTGLPVNAAQVTLVPGASTVQTDTEGSFSFTSLKEGRYTISVQKSGYQANRKDITVVSGEETAIVITLSAIPK